MVLIVQINWFVANLAILDWYEMISELLSISQLTFEQIQFALRNNNLSLNILLTIININYHLRVINIDPINQFKVRILVDCKTFHPNHKKIIKFKFKLFMIFVILVTVGSMVHLKVIILKMILLWKTNRILWRGFVTLLVRVLISSLFIQSLLHLKHTEWFILRLSLLVILEFLFSIEKIVTFDVLKLLVFSILLSCKKSVVWSVQDSPKYLKRNDVKVHKCDNQKLLY